MDCWIPQAQDYQNESCDQLRMFPAHHQAQLDLGEFRVLAADFEEDDEMAAARDVVTADLKCFQECDIRGVPQASTPPPVLHLQQHLHGPPYLKQEASVAAGSSCGASSPQASCDTAAAAHRAQQFWASAQQYDAYNPMLAHLPASHYPAGFMQDTPYTASTAAVLAMAGMAPCTGPCCYPQAPLMPQGSSSLPLGMSSAVQTPGDYCFSPSMQAYAGTGMYPAGAGSGSMVPHGAFSTVGMMPRNDSSSGSPAGVPSPSPAQQPSRQQLQRGYSSYPGVLQGGIQKRSSTAGAKAAPAEAAAPMPRKSADGSCSSKDGSPAQPPRARKSSKGAAASGSGSAGRSRGSSMAASGAANLAVSGSAATLIKELQQEIEALTASKAELKTQVRSLLTSQTDLLSRVSTLTNKWQQAVAENAALHRQNLQYAASQCM